MDRVKVYELARQLNEPNWTLVQEFRNLGYDILDARDEVNKVQIDALFKSRRKKPQSGVAKKFMKISDMDELLLEVQKRLGIIPGNDELLIFDRVKRVILNFSCNLPSEVRFNADLIEDLGFDSLDLVELTMALEEEFVMEITDEDAEKITSVADIVRYIDRALS